MRHIVALITLIVTVVRAPILRRARTINSGCRPLGVGRPLGIILLPSTHYRDWLLQVSPKHGRKLKARLAQLLQHSFPFSFSDTGENS